MAIIDIFY